MQTRVHKNKRVIFIAILSLTLALALTACSSNDSADGANNTENNEVTNSDRLIKEGDSLLIPTSEISETAEFYFVTVDDTRMGVVAVKTPDGKIRTAFDTCQVCNGSPKAYFEQSGSSLQCQNCGNKFPMNRVEVEAGGCNPIPIFEKDKTVTDESITISYETLKVNKGLFPSNWKK
ncbi:MAG: DUF2318 domain-containing protein [Clostridiales bacterium]|jgi:uncharacterized membrane protein|nr:DUF2318 domain-containing protein [Clostridiales bacterium]